MDTVAIAVAKYMAGVQSDEATQVRPTWSPELERSELSQAVLAAWAPEAGLAAEPPAWAAELEAEPPAWAPEAGLAAEPPAWAPDLVL